jgi:phage tail-like protein
MPADDQYRGPDPYITTKFWFEIGTTLTGFFTECSGLNAETEITEYAEGGLNDYTIKLPGRTKFSNVTLRRGWVDSDDLWNWYLKVIEGNVETKSVSIVLYKNAGTGQAEEKARWNLEQAFPVKWQGPTFKVEGTAAVVETLELAHRGFRRQ